MASAVDTATPLSGTGLLDDGAQLVHAIESGDWLAGGLSAFAVGVDTVAAVSDPLGSLIASGLGWLIDHLEPIKGWFDDLTGNAGEVEAFAATWTNIQTQLQASGAELTRRVTDLDSLAGEAIDAYRRFQADAAAHLAGAASWAGAMATGLRVASQVVQLVHDLVRDVLSQLVGSAISWAAEAVFSLGLATPWIIEQVSTRVASWVAKIGTKLTELLTACKKLAGLLGELHGLISKAGALFENALRKTAPALRRTVAGDQGELNLDELMRSGRTMDDVRPQVPPDRAINIVDLLTQLPTGRQNFVRVVPDDAAVRRVFEELSIGSRPGFWQGFRGTVVECDDGTQIGLREYSKSGGPSIDIKLPDGTRYRIHVDHS
ncbi:hypothetical protein [Microbacterium mangrovi]|uniref:hypothetical protein n=1 Tax=Microbacterium mangrovi TaxID=1348253 RepID=UPI00068E4144|nr:hypothetical protein [Microbacterium mangrovi]